MTAWHQFVTSGHRGTTNCHDNFGYRRDKYLIQYAEWGLSGGTLYAAKSQLVYI
jgi:hypothetical protein